MAMVAFFSWSGHFTDPFLSGELNCFCTQDTVHTRIRNDSSEQVCVCVSVCVCVCVCVYPGSAVFFADQNPIFLSYKFCFFLLTTIQFFDARFLANPSASRKKRHHHLLQKDIKLVSLQVPRNHSQQCTRPVGTLFLGHFNKNWDGLLFCFCFWSICFGHAH